MKRSTLEVFEPITACACGGGCRPRSPDDLARFDSALDWLRTQGLEVKHYDPSRQYGDYLGSAVFVKAVNQHGLGWLPLLVLDGEIVSHGDFPGREELAALVGLNQAGLKAVASQNNL
jgi:hypothetical protein